jgi:hypothetical protein
MASNTVTFRVYPERGRQYYQVHIWPTRTTMREYLRDCQVGRGWRDVLAFVLWREVKGRGRRSHCIGEIHFNRRDLGPEIVTHEVAHAALEWARRQNLDIDDTSDPTAANADEERLCDAIGSLTAQIERLMADHSLRADP